MKTFANHPAWLGSLAVASCLALSFTSAVRAEEMTARTLVDRQQIQDLITHYYYNFGKENPENFSDFYADDAALILGTKRYEGKAGIMQAYGRGGGAPPAAAVPAAGAAPAVPAAGAAASAAGAAPAAAKPKTTFYVTISNPLIIVHGETATSEVIFTEYRQEKPGDPMKMTTQGKEYGTFVKVKGQWRYKTRQIASGNEPPADWKE